MKSRHNDVLLFSGIFLVLFVFFYVAHPLILFDSDDWEMCSYFRRPLPMPGGYNGIKVFPETLFPILTEIAANFVYPIMKDYLMSLALVFAVTGALFISIYCRVFVSLTRTIMDDKESIIPDLLAVCFLAFHFLIYKNDWFSNTHLFWSGDVTCFIHYVLTGVFNAAMVLWFMNKAYIEGDSFEVKPVGIKDGAVLLAIYFAVFSNMFTNIILVSFAAVEIFSVLLTKRKDKNAIKRFMVSRWYYPAVLIMWAFALVIQLLDPRNADAKKQISTKIGISEIVKSVVANFTAINKMCLLIFAVMVVMFVVCVFRKGEKVVKTSEAVLLVKIIAAGFFTLLYLILLSAVSGINYVGRSDVALGYYFYMFLFFMIVFGIALKNVDGKESGLGVVLPLLTFVTVAQTINSCKSYRDYNDFALTKEQVYSIGQDILNQYFAADMSGAENMELHVLANEERDNTWPYTFYVGDAISDSLSRHGVISKFIKCTVIYDRQKDEEFKVGF